MSFFSSLGKALGSITGGDIIGAGASIFGANQNAKAQQSANQTNIQLQQMQQDYNTQMWNANNAYNDPSAQKQRLLNAGLNPWLMAQDGQVATGNSSAPAQGVAPAQVQPVNKGNAILSAVNNVLQTRMLKAQVDEAEAHAQEAQANANHQNVLTPTQNRNIQADTTLKQGQDQLNDQIRSNMKQDSDFHTFTYSLAQKYAPKLDEQQLKLLTNQVRDVAQDIALKRSESKLNNAEAITEISKRVLNYATANHMNVDAQSIAMHIVPEINAIDEEARESITRQGKNRAEESKARNDVDMNDMPHSMQSIFNAATLGTGALLNNFFR